MLPVEYFCSNNVYFLSVNSHGDQKIIIKLRLVLGILPDLRQWFVIVIVKKLRYISVVTKSLLDFYKRGKSYIPTTGCKVM